MKTFLCGWVAMVIFGGSIMADPARELAKEVAEASGLSRWQQVEKIKFTFHVQLPDQVLQRTWAWNPKSGEVVQYGNDGPALSWKRSELASASAEIKEADARFINDSYWLIFPFRVVWDQGTALSLDASEQNLPFGEGKGRKLTVTYTGEGGYTPGDAYDLFIGKDNRIAAWVFRKGNAPEPTRITRWEEYRDFGGIPFSMNRPGPDGFRIWFTDVSVEYKN
jgi:hypothetical protein